MNPKILVVEDDNPIRNLIVTALKIFGYSYRFAVDSASAIQEAITFLPDIYILDLCLPDGDGNEIIRVLRSWTDNPIIVISARNGVQDKITTLDNGADDYLTKPFSIDELMAHIRVAQRRSVHNPKHEQKNIYVNGDLFIDYAANIVKLRQKELNLTRTEYRLLCLLAKNEEKVLTHNFILESIWPNPLESDIYNLRVMVASLRKKLENDRNTPTYIQTHIGVGYRMMRL
jgi:two-component system KDP operon response regulator KdpE